MDRPTSCKLFECLLIKGQERKSYSETPVARCFHTSTHLMLTTTWTDRHCYPHFLVRRIKAWMVRSVHLLQSMKVVSARAEIQAGLVWLQTFHDIQASPCTRRDLIKTPDKKKEQVH